MNIISRPPGAELRARRCLGDILDERCTTAAFRLEWGDVLRDLDRLQEIEIDKDGRRITLRTPATGVIGPLFKATRIALPANVRDPEPA